MNVPDGDDDDHARTIVRFSLAGLEVMLRSRDDALAGLSPGYGYAAAELRADEGEGNTDAAAPPALIVDVARVAGLGAGMPRPANYPAFTRGRSTTGGIRLQRPDVDGELELPTPDGDDDDAQPIRGRFVVGDSHHSVESVIRAGASVAVARRGGLILHASAVEVNGAALLFSGPSGAGKSTIATLLASRPGVRKLADDLLIVMPVPVTSTSGSRFVLHTVPFLAKEPLPRRSGVPIAGWHAIAQHPRHRRESLAAGAATRELLRHVLVHVVEPRTAAWVLAATLAFTAAVPCHRLQFAKDAGVAEVLDIT